MTRNTRRRLQWTVDTAKAMLSRAPQAILAQYARDNAEDTLHELDRMAPEIAQTLLGALPVPRVATFSRWRDAAGDIIDSGIAIYFPAPGSFTGDGTPSK